MVGDHFGVGIISGAVQIHYPSEVTVLESHWAVAMLLEKEVTYAKSGPVGTEAGASLHVEDFHTLAYGFDDGCFRGLERGLKQRELAAGTEEWVEGRHDVAQLGVIGYLVNEAKPASDVGCGDRGGKFPNGI